MDPGRVHSYKEMCLVEVEWGSSTKRCRVRQKEKESDIAEVVAERVAAYYYLGPPAGMIWS